MEGLYFEVKPRRDEPSGSLPKITLNRRSRPSLPHLASSASCPQKPVPSARKRRIASWGEKVEEEEEEVQYKLTLIGSLPVHRLTTMAMLPWVVAEIGKSAERSPGATSRSGGHSGPSACNQTVLLCVSASWVRCVSVLGEGVVWDPLTRTVLLECRPHQVTKLIHNSQEPSGFGCLVRGAPGCSCYVFRCQDSTKGFHAHKHTPDLHSPFTSPPHGELSALQTPSWCPRSSRRPLMAPSTNIPKTTKVERWRDTE